MAVGGSQLMVTGVVPGVPTGGVAVTVTVV
jgi:hypothetical protein